MLFSSPQYLLNFAAVFALHWAVPRHVFRVGLLVVTSFVFYALWNRWLAGLVVASTVADYVLARAIDSSLRRAAARRSWPSA